MRQTTQRLAWRNTYAEHVLHGRHRARVPLATISGQRLVEGRGFLQFIMGGRNVWSERRYPIEGIDQGDSEERRCSTIGGRTLNMYCMFVTEAVFQSLIG
jgi:hypothetical protein